MVKPKNMLRKKLCRDMSRAAMQFLSIIALCALGTFAFSALDGMARMIRTTLNTYYEENNLADFWITLPTADRASMEKLAALPDVEAVCARASVDLDTTLPGDVSVSVTVYDGEMTINKPLLREGALLEANDPRGCLVEERFAQSKGLSLGDRLTVKLRGRPYSFTIRGVVVSPEYIVVTDGMAAVSDYTYLYTCGPEPMLKAVYDACKTSGQFSFEERMGCGFGACMGCSCKTKYGNKRICKDGPVLEKEEIVW